MGEGAKSNDGEKAWSSIYHSILSGVAYSEGGEGWGGGGVWPPHTQQGPSNYTRV